jgi:hypothetical protein
MFTKEFHYYRSSGRVVVGVVNGLAVVYAQQCYCQLQSPLSATVGPGLYLKTEAYGLLVELGVQFYGLYMWCFALVSLCLPLHNLTSLYTRFLKQINLHVINSFYSRIQPPLPV